MSDFGCPQCKRRVDAGEIPDHLSEMRHNRFTYECECGTSFEVDVDFEPVFYVRRDTILRAADKDRTEP